MAFRVELTPRAQDDLDKIYTAISGVARHSGSLWCDRFEQAILSLGNLPKRCPVEPSLSTAARPVRKLLYGNRRNAYRIYYAIYDDVVRIIHVRHSSRRNPGRLRG
jgi:plasmid stabilization system protein ParE